jgi:hypothetical protein
MYPRNDFEALVASLESHPGIRGKRVAEIPDLAAVRLAFRRTCYRNANWAFFLAVFNAVLAFAPGYGLRWLSALSALAMVALMAWAELKARQMSRQLARPASVQVARDLMEIPG